MPTQSAKPVWHEQSEPPILSTDRKWLSSSQNGSRVGSFFSQCVIEMQHRKSEPPLPFMSWIAVQGDKLVFWKSLYTFTYLLQHVYVHRYFNYLFINMYSIYIYYIYIYIYMYIRSFTKRYFWWFVNVHMSVARSMGQRLTPATGGAPNKGPYAFMQTCPRTGSYMQTHVHMHTRKHTYMNISSHDHTISYIPLRFLDDLWFEFSCFCSYLVMHFFPLVIL